MSTIIIAHDDPSKDTETLRQEHLPAHLEHVEAHLDALQVAGPMRGPNGDTVASVLIMATDDRAEAEALFKQDPYYKAGIYGEVQIETFLGVAGDWVGGKAW